MAIDAAFIETIVTAVRDELKSAADFAEVSFDAEERARNICQSFVFEENEFLTSTVEAIDDLDLSLFPTEAHGGFRDPAFRKKVASRVLHEIFSLWIAEVTR